MAYMMVSLVNKMVMFLKKGELPDKMIYTVGTPLEPSACLPDATARGGKAVTCSFAGGKVVDCKWE